jgi:pimeloyl-ACP methyl ester carboxylesterase
MDHCVRDRLSQVAHPTLMISGQDDRIVDPEQAAAAAKLLSQGQFMSIPQCGHAPQMEKPWLINRLVVEFLTGPCPTAKPRVPEPVIMANPSSVA